MSEPVSQNNGAHTQILKSTTLIGGSSVINVVFKIIQAKVAAVLIGPAGVGLMGLFSSILGLATTLAGMGLTTSGVRQIADAVGSGDELRIARTVKVFRWLAFLFGGLGAIALLILQVPISKLTFGTDEQAPVIGALSIALWLMVISGAQSTLIRGTRRIGDLARVTIIGIAVGTVLGIPILYVMKIKGVAPYLILSALTTTGVSWWYTRKIHIVKIPLHWRDVSHDALDLLALGVVFMVTSLATLATPYFVKVVVARQLGLGAAGQYEATSALSNVYVGFILGAMGADFFPHLTAVVNDRIRRNQLINAQIEIGLLVATPGVLIVLALGPFLLQALYSSEFSSAFSILRWQALGTFLRVMSWPFGFLVLARGNGRLFFLTELSANALFFGASIFGVGAFGLLGIGLAFFLMYVYYTLLMMLVARRLIQFRWSSRNKKLVTVLFPVTILAFISSVVLRLEWSVFVGVLLAMIVGLYSMRVLYTLIGPETVRRYWGRIRARLRWSRA